MRSVIIIIMVTIWSFSVFGEEIEWERHIIDGSFIGAWQALPIDMDRDGDLDAFVDYQGYGTNCICDGRRWR